MALVSLRDVYKEYPLGNTVVHAVKGVCLDVEDGEFFALAGPSGSGKSTVLNLIGCIDTPTRGAVSIGGVATKDLGDKRLTALRRKSIGFIFQSFNLVPVLDVYENVEFPLLLGPTDLQGRARREWIDGLIEAVGLGPWRRHRPNELSGGQRQRVAIARALAARPRLVLADEPTANLDSATGASIMALMKRMNRDHGTTFVFSTHDAAIMEAADRVVRLLDGAVAEEARAS